jgi:hypothetical protein
VHDVILDLTFGKGTPFNKDGPGRSFLLLEVRIVLESPFFGVNFPTSGSGDVLGR